ncbi:MAG TPA: DinB family protein [Anaerolinea sp.]|nr:DinB family protein [Anaerolinea sp.]
MLIEVERKQLDEFLLSARQFESAVAGLREEQLDLHAAPGEWSIRQIVHHVADDGDVWCMLIKHAIAQPGYETVFGEFPGNEAWANGLETHRRGVRAALGLIQAHRAYLTELVAHFPDAWENTIVIRDAAGTTTQPVSVGQIVDMLAEHMREHTASVRAIREAHCV